MDMRTVKCEQKSQIGDARMNNEVDQNTANAVAIATVDEPPPKLFRLNVDCFEHVFEWLSLKELLVFRSTCKPMKLVVGDYIQLKYKKLQQQKIGNLVNERLPREQRSKYLEWCKDLRLFNIFWNNADSEGIKNVLNQIEALKLDTVRIDGDLHDVILKYCPQLKRLGIRIYADLNFDPKLEWLGRTYPKLKHIEIYDDTSLHWAKLLTFFEQNPNIRVFSVNSKFLLALGQLFLESNIKFDRLNIELDHKLNVIHDLVNELYKRGFYKQLHLYCIYAAPLYVYNHAHHLSTFYNLEKLDVSGLFCDFPLTKMNDIIELEIIRFYFVPAEKIPDLINLKCICVHSATLKEISILVCHVPKLREIKISREINEGETYPPKKSSDLKFNDLQTSDLVALNEEREKLSGARKVTIFIPENNFLKIKWTAKTNFSLIEFKRIESCEKNYLFLKY